MPERGTAHAARATEILGVDAAARLAWCAADAVNAALGPIGDAIPGVEKDLVSCAAYAGTWLALTRSRSR